MLQNAHQLDVGVGHVLYVGDQLVDQLEIGQRATSAMTPRQGMHLVDIEGRAQLVGYCHLGVTKFVVGLDKPRRPIEVILDETGKRVGAQRSVSVLAFDGELVSEAMSQAGHLDLPHSRATPPLQGMSAHPPAIEIAHD